MQERQPKGSGIIILTLIISRIIIFIGIRWVFFREPTVTPGDGGDVLTNTTKYYIGEQVLLEGILKPSTDITQFSHTLTTSEGMTFGLKSVDISLSEYTGNVQLRGKVSTFKKAIPIIEISDIVGSNGMDDETDQTDTTTDTAGSVVYRYFSAYELSIDLRTFPGYSVKELGNEIQILDTTQKVALSILPFRCVAGDSTQDCSILEKRLNEQKATRFTTAEGVGLAKFTETNKWYAFNGNKFGYTITASSDDVLQTMAGVLSFLSTAQVSNYLEEARVLCKNIRTKLTNVEDHTVTISPNGRIELVLKGTSDADAKAVCTVISQAPTINKFTLSSYNDGGVQKTDPRKETDSPKIDSLTPSAVGDIPVPTNLSSWVNYPSVRGRTLYMSKNTVAYVGGSWTGSEQPGCPYHINLYYRNKDTDTVPADGRIFECSPSGIANLQSQGYTAIGATGDVTFLMKHLTEDIAGVNFFIQ